MKLTGEQTYDAPPDVVWKAILDPEVLSRTLPGCEELRQTGDNEFSGKLKMKVGPVQGVFEGKVTLSDLDPPNGYHLSIDGRGAPGFMTGNGRLELEPHGTGTLLRYDLDAQVGGRIASVGQRLIESSAKVISKQGLEGLGRQLAALVKETPPVTATTSEAATGDGPSAVATPASATPDTGPIGVEAETTPQTATAAPPPPSQAAFAGAFVAGLAGELLPKERRPAVAVAVVLLAVALFAVFLRTCA